MTSKDLHKLFSHTERDEHVFELTDYPGLQIVRRYKSALKGYEDKRMFIKLVLLKDEQGPYVAGGVDIVRNQTEKQDGWTVEFPEGIFFKTPTNYFFGRMEGVFFDETSKNFVFREVRYSVNNFIDLLERNHLRDMFLVSRFTNTIKLGLLHLVFFLSDAKFNKFDYIFTNRERRFTLEEDVKLPSDGADPLFHYFYIYKNLLGIGILIALGLLVYLSTRMSASQFNMSNPFFLFSAFLALYLLEKLSDLMFYLIKKTTFIQQVTRSAVELRGNLKG